VCFLGSRCPFSIPLSREPSFLSHRVSSYPLSPPDPTPVALASPTHHRHLSLQALAAPQKPMHPLHALQVLSFFEFRANPDHCLLTLGKCCCSLGKGLEEL